MDAKSCGAANKSGAKALWNAGCKHHPKPKSKDGLTMANHEERWGLPRLLAPFRNESIELPYDLEEDPEIEDAQLAVQMSLNGSTEAQPTTAYNRLRIMMRGLPTATKRKLDYFWDNILKIGEPVEFYADSKRLFHLAGAEGYCVRTRRFATGTWSVDNAIFTHIWAESLIGIFGVSENLIKNGDAKDGTTDWTASHADLGLEAVHYLPPGGVTSYCLRAFAAVVPSVTRYFYQDVTLSGALTGVPYVSLSFAYRSEHFGDAALDDVIIHIQAADGSGTAITGAPWTYSSQPYWTRLNLLVDLSGLGTPTGSTLRVSFQITAVGLAAGPVSFADIQVEEKKFNTGFIARAGTGSTRTATGIRAAAESMRFVNPLNYVSRIPHFVETPLVQFGFTVACGYVSGWTEGASGTPYGNMYLWSMGIKSSSSSNEMAGAFLTNMGVVTVRGLKQDTGTFLSATSNQTIGPDTTKHVVMSWLDWDGSTPDSGKLRLYVDGTLISTTDHSSWIAGNGDFLWIGSDPDGTYPASGWIYDLTVDAVYIDGTTYTIGNFYSATDRPDRFRTGWRARLDPGQKGRPCRLSKSDLYDLDLKLIESRMT